MRELRERYNEELSNYRRAKGWLEEVKEGSRETSELNFAEAELKLKKFMINLELIRIEMEKASYIMTDKEIQDGFPAADEETVKNQIKLEV